MNWKERATRLGEIEISLQELREEAGRLRTEELEDLRKGGRGIRAWLGYRFESSSGLTPEFALFARAYKKHITDLLGNGFSLAAWSRGHFEASGFVKNKTTGHLAYFSCPDVRVWLDQWYNNILVRTAKDEKDYTGCTNNYCTLDTLSEAITRLTA